MPKSVVRVMRDPVPYDDLIESSVKLDPIKALGLQNGSRVVACTSPLYMSVLIGGEEKRLRLMKRNGEKLVPTDAEDPDGEYAGIYPRVSTAFQVDNGWSARDQIERAVLDCIKEGYAFRVFNDQGLSGRLPMNAPHLIRKMREKRADLFYDLFNKVFLDPALQGRFTPLERFRLEQYRDTRKSDILRGTDDDGLDLDAQDDEAVREVAINGKLGKPSYRPALTILLHDLPSIHALYISDQSRLCRSASLFLEILDQLRRNRVRIQGTIASLDWINTASNWTEMIGFIMASMAQSQLEDVLLGSLRGIFAMLMAGKPHGKCGFWIERDDDTKRVFLGDGKPVIEVMIDLYLNQDERGADRGYTAVARALDDREIMTPGGKKKALRWNPNTVRSNLTNHALRGVQEMFGIEWNVLPAVTDDETYWQIQARLLRRAAVFGGPQGEIHLLANFLRCSCGAALGWTQNSNGYHRYTCEALKASREDYSISHVTLHHRRIEEFVNGLMTFGYDVLVKELTDTADQDELRQDLLRLSERAAAMRARVEAEIAKQRDAVAPIVLQLAKPDSPDFEDFMLRAINTRLADDENYRCLCLELQQLEQRREKLQEALTYATPAEEFRALIESGRQWPSLSVPRRNALLLDFFRGGRIIGVAPNEQLILQLRTFRDAYLSPIPIYSRKRSNTQWERRLPDVEEWLFEATEPE